jgi:hypothetical protein
VSLKLTTQLSEVPLINERIYQCKYVDNNPNKLVIQSVLHINSLVDKQLDCICDWHVLIPHSIIKRDANIGQQILVVDGKLILDDSSNQSVLS